MSLQYSMLSVPDCCYWTLKRLSVCCLMARQESAAEDLEKEAAEQGFVAEGVAPSPEVDADEP